MNTNLSLSGIRRRRTGKVARLPEAVRTQINQMLDDGLPYAVIITKLGESGRGLNYHNLKHWRRGGYQDHLKTQFRKEHADIRALFVRKLVEKTSGADLPSAAVQALNSSMSSWISIQPNSGTITERRHRLHPYAQFSKQTEPGRFVYG